MTYELSSQGMIYRIRAHLFRRIENQDMEFYDRNRTGDLMTRLTGDLDMVRHAVAFVFKGMLESCSLFIASSVYGKLENGTSSAGCYTVHIRRGGAS